MSTATQARRSMAVATALPFDTLLLMGFAGEEGLSRLFRFQVDLFAPDPSKVTFEALLGRAASLRLALPGGRARYISGIVASMTEGARTTDGAAFGIEVVPAAWLLTRRARSRIFQGATVPEILQAVFQGIPDVSYRFDGDYPPRDFCVQYRETDFNFASRLMEEEGISYFFEHAADTHRMVITDRAQYPDLENGRDLILQPLGEAHLRDDRVTHWEKSQRIGPGKVTLRDHTFELPHQPLEAEGLVPDAVKVGGVTHRLRVGGAESLEVYDWPGEYAQRFDGVDRGGHDRPADLDRIFRENKRTAGLRAEEEAADAIAIRGSSRYRHLVSGRTFTLAEVAPDTYKGPRIHDGAYVLTSISHVGRIGDTYRSGGDHEDVYQNSFTCLPAGLPFRPRRTTPRPVIQGAQSAVVVGPPGEEIHTDKYGRVRVKFHWDREAKGDDSSSCWIRVAQTAGGAPYSAMHIPRVGQEVMVAFEEGDPDRPIVVGSVYNPSNMPPYGLPASKMISGLRTNSYPGGGGYNEIIVNDAKGSELIRIHGQHDMDTTVENDLREAVKNDRKRTVRGNESIRVNGNRTENVSKNQKEGVGGDMTVNVTGKQSTEARSVSVTAKTEITLTAQTRIVLTCGASTVVIDQASVTINAPVVKINS